MTDYLAIEDYGIIGDLNTAALVGNNGSIDFMCFPEFDSPTIFARLLDSDKGGYFQIKPSKGETVNKQLYIPDSNILLTRFLTKEGVCEVSDFMPIEPDGHSHLVIRRAKAVRGDFSMQMVCQPAFNYARQPHQIEVTGATAEITSEDLQLKVSSNTELDQDDQAVIANFRLKQGETVFFVLELVNEKTAETEHTSESNAKRFIETLNFWQEWVGKSDYQGRWREMVHRSALVLKLLTSKAYGSMVAAPTFGLPEEIGGKRNWDYRYTWIRDASFTVYGLIRLGYLDEAQNFNRWLRERCTQITEWDDLQIMYQIDGSPVEEEKALPHLEGYQGSQPVRIGNKAANQLQLDIYGELMDAIYLTDKYGDKISHSLWKNIGQMIDWVSENWDQPDEGIWEFRGGRHDFLYSRLMCWVAIDRGIRLSEKRSFPAPLEKWQSARDDIYQDIFSNFWNEEKGAFVQEKNGSALDASSLLMPLVKFISPTDPLFLRHLEAVEKELVVDSFVKRYRPEDSAGVGVAGKEGTFSMCTFWYVECLSRAGKTRKARLIFEKMLGYANHLGLFSEQLGMTGNHLGNYPQAFTHLALISTAYDLNRRL